MTAAAIELGHRLHDRSDNRTKNVGCRGEPAPPYETEPTRDRPIRSKAHLPGLRRAAASGCRHLTVGAHRSTSFAATTRQPGRVVVVGDVPRRAGAGRQEPHQRILVPADAELTLEGYLDERGLWPSRGTNGEYMGYYGQSTWTPYSTHRHHDAPRRAAHTCARISIASARRQRNITALAHRWPRR